PVIEVSGLHKEYGPKVAVDDVSFSVEPGEIFGILGPNGAGKTTSVECITGLRKPDRGRISVLGLDPQRDHDELREQVGVQLQDGQLPEKIWVREALELYASFYQHPANADELITRLGLDDRRDAPFDKLSGGQKQRLSVALALIGRPKVAVLDELTTGLDPSARREVWGLISDIRDTGVTVLLVTHFMEEAERLCDRLAVIDHGRVIATDTPSGLAGRAGGEQYIRFTASGPLETGALSVLSEVHSVRREGDQFAVTGNEEALQAVMGVLIRRGIIARHLRLDQASLDDAFVALTQHDPADRDAANAAQAN
ncbi:MAG TPA: ABC transporter ATP-binding protein, partial [Streptosporangiaceae bacterium]|nr:ABC transporter ATP-binding protein [Streptosporangiaceae bacterium]